MCEPYRLDENNRGAMAMISIGSSIPHFSLLASLPLNVAQSFTTITHEQASGRWRIYVFWPRDFTPICATELVSYGGLLSEFEERDTDILGCSTDSQHAHVAWRQAVPNLKYLPIPMLSDGSHQLTSTIGILEPEQGVAHRATFITDPLGTIRHIMVNDFNVGRNSKETLRVLDALQTDELCPSDWQRGEPVLNIEQSRLMQKAER
jgi:peroxiredoxin (alkyl hydroperoxide reductase subunit C)